jgi:hypothetical protein
MNKRLVTDTEFENLLANGRQYLSTALMDVVGGMRAVPGVGAKFDAAKVEATRYRVALARGKRIDYAEGFPVLDREVLVQGWAEWYLTVETAAGRAVDCRSAIVRTGEPGYKVSYRGVQDGVWGTVFYDGGARAEVVGRFLVGTDGVTTIKGMAVESPLGATAWLIKDHKEGQRLICQQAAAFGVPA